MAMRKKPSVDDFIGSAAANDSKASKHTKKDSDSSANQERVAKLVRIPKGMLISIKRRAIDESEQSGERISENDIVEKALSKYLSTKIS